MDNNLSCGLYPPLINKKSTNEKKSISTVCSIIYATG